MANYIPLFKSPFFALLFSLTVFANSSIKASANNIAVADTASLFKDNGTFITLDNGIVQAKITKANAHITSYRYKGMEMLKDGYYSMDGGKGYSQPNRCEVTIKAQSANRVDVAFKSTWQPGLRQQAFDIEAHYVIEKGTAGIYCYALLNHPAEYPKTGVGEWRYVWKIDQSQFDHIYIDSLRNMEMPTMDDLAKAEHTSIPEAVKLTTGVKAGKYECKYEYSVEYYKEGTYGHTNNKKNYGAWMILGGYDFFNDGPTQADLNAAAGGILVHFGRDHYYGSGTAVEAGEQWSKIYGPFLLYFNTGKTGNAMWVDAKNKVAEEKAKWPYTWLTNTHDYPLAAQRGTAKGRFKVNDPFKPGIKGANAWVGLTVAGAEWQRDSKHYQYWVKTDVNGEFTIPDIRPGTYTVHAFTDGEVDEFAKDNMTVKAGGTLNIGDLTWNIPRGKGKLVWEIGIPNRSAAEFKFGDQYWNSFMWETYSPALTNPLVYTVGTSDWRKDWNYVHSSYFAGDGKFEAWPWKINFKIAKLAQTGVATLTFAFASVDRARLQTYVNDDATPFNTFTAFTNAGGNALVRQGIHAKYSTYVLTIPVSKLHEGNNTITLLQASAGNRTNHIMYDYISLEVPE